MCSPVKQQGHEADQSHIFLTTALTGVVKCGGQEIVELYLHSHIPLHGIVLS
jgi:hypothetical protein